MKNLYKKIVTHKIWIFSILIVVLISSNSCIGDDKTKENTSAPNITDDNVQSKNYIILLDLSDRLLNDNQIDRDIQLITKVFDGFYEHVRYKKFFIKSNDKFKIVFAKQNGIPYSKSEEENKLYLDMNV